METASDLKGVLPSILKQTSQGKINVYEAESLSRFVETQQRTADSELAERVRALEEHGSNPLIPVHDENLKPVDEAQP
jgi:hypothetical protein